MEELRWNGLVVDHENDVSKIKSTINRLVVLCQNGFVCKEMRLKIRKYRSK
jgi:hypothetical protein